MGKYPYRPAKGKMTAIEATNRSQARIAQIPTRPCPLAIGDKVQFKIWEGASWLNGEVIETEWMAFWLMGEFRRWWSIKVTFSNAPYYSHYLDDEKPEEFKKIREAV